MNYKSMDIDPTIYRQTDGQTDRQTHRDTHTLDEIEKFQLQTFMRDNKKIKLLNLLTQRKTWGGEGGGSEKTNRDYRHSTIFIIPRYQISKDINLPVPIATIKTLLL